MENDIVIIRNMLRDESEAVAHYEEAANKALNPTLKKILHDIKEEEMVHIGELKQALKEIYGISDNDKEGEGKMEVNNILAKEERIRKACAVVDMAHLAMFPTLSMKIRQLKK